MNPKEEIFIPGEPHFYSRRTDKKADCRPENTKGFRSWYRNHKPQALSLLNLFILLPVVLLVYPYLVNQSEQPETHRLGPLEFKSYLSPGEDGVDWVLTAAAEAGTWEGNVEVVWDFNGIQRTITLYLSSDMVSNKEIVLVKKSFEDITGTPLLKVSCRWEEKTVEWNQFLPPLN